MEAERETIDRYVAAWLAARVGEVFPTRITGVQSFGFFATIVGLGGDGLVPVSTLGREHFRWEEGAQRLVGDNSGTTYAPGDRLELRLAEANPLTGALKFELPDSEGRIEPRGRRPRTARQAQVRPHQAGQGRAAAPATSATRGAASARPAGRCPRR